MTAAIVTCQSRSTPDRTCSTPPLKREARPAKEAWLRVISEAAGEEFVNMLLAAAKPARIKHATVASVCGTCLLWARNEWERMNYERREDIPDRDRDGRDGT